MITFPDILLPLFPELYPFLVELQRLKISNAQFHTIAPALSFKFNNIIEEKKCVHENRLKRESVE